MTEIKLFSPGTAFNDAYKKSRTNTLAGLAFNSQGAERQNALSQLAGLNPAAAQSMKTSLDDSDYESLIKSSKLLVSLKGNPELASQAYQRMKPQYAALGLNLPEQLDESVWQSAEQIAAAYGGSTSSNVQSTFIDPDGNLNYLSRDGRTVNTGKRVSDKFSPIIDPVTGAVSGYSGRGNTLSSTSVGAAPESPDTAAKAASQLQAIYNKLVQGGMDTVQAEEMAFSVLRDSGVLAPQKQAKVSVPDKAAAGVPSGYRMGADGKSLEAIPGGPADPAIKAAEQAQSLDSRKATEQRKALRQDAINFAAAWLEKSPEEVALMSPQAIREAVAKGGRMTTGPIMGSIWGMNKIANSDLEAYRSSAAAKQARINNPSGPVTEGDFRAAEKSVFSPDKPAQVNADLIYQALTAGSQPAPMAQPKPSNGPKPGDVVKGYRFRGGNPADPNSWVKAQ